MSWQLSSFAIVLGSLAVAFWWYERSHPPAKLVAVIATLAALAALGRDAFAAVPDVKPITAIVLVSGVAFGARPGFAIGAISALASNILLGQGPWTPWQMLGWGLVGLFGAALRPAVGERPSPLVLALACALGAELFNLVLNVYTWTGTGNHSLAAYGVVLGSALVFDLTHVVASFAFGFAFGPALLRMLARVRARLQVDWQRIALPPASLLMVLCVSALALSACAQASKPDAAVPARVAIARQLAYLKAAQNPDGGFGAVSGQPSSELYTAWAAIGLAAAGRNPSAVSRDGHSVLDALRAEAGTLHGAGDLERTILALRACGASVRSLAGGDPVVRLLSYRASDGSFAHLSNLTSFAILALRAAGYGSHDPTLAGAARWLARQQEPNGAFGFATRGGGGDIDDTAAAMQALRGTRYTSALSRGVGFLRRAQNLDGGFPQQQGGPSNAQSSAWAIQALAAAGIPAGKVTRKGSRSPVAYLQTLIGARRQRALLAHGRPDAGVGDRAGAHGLRAAPAARLAVAISGRL